MGLRYMGRSEQHGDDGATEGPRLDIREPVAAGRAIFLIVAAAIAGAATFVPVEQVVRLDGIVADRAERTEIKAPLGGEVATVNVTDGQLVAAGDALVSLDSKGIGEELAALKAQLEAANKQLEVARMEATTVADLAGRKAASSQQLETAKKQAAEAEAEATRLADRIGAVKQEIERSVVRAPFSGRVQRLSLVSGKAVATGAALLELAASGRQWTIDTCEPAHRDSLVAVGAPLYAWTGGGMDGWTAASGTIAGVTARREPASLCPDGARIDVERRAGEGREWRPGIAVSLEIKTGKRPLIDQLAFWSNHRKPL